MSSGGGGGRGGEQFGCMKKCPSFRYDPASIVSQYHCPLFLAM